MSESKLSLETGMLAFTRSVQVTEGAFFATVRDRPEDRLPIEVKEKGVRGQSSEDKAQNPGKSNPQSVEYAVIPQGYNGVELTFSIRFMPFCMKPHACDSPDVAAAYCKLAKDYRNAGGFRTLARLFAWNIVNARFAWRNRFQSDNMQVSAEFQNRYGENKKVVVDPMTVSIDRPDDEFDVTAAELDGFEELKQGVADGLSNAEEQAFTVKIKWTAEMEQGQEIFPSQEYVREGKKDDQLSRVYAKLFTLHKDRPISQASMHSQKIGAALRHIDIWYDDVEPAIAVNPYGGVQNTGEIKRDPKSKKDFYSLRKQADKLLKELENGEVSSETHFIMANLVRGGVFGKSGK